MSPDDSPALSVVIPTRDRVSVLLGTLQRLEAQASAAPGAEVIVVDDGSVDGTARTVDELASSFALPLVVLRQESRGPAAARNRGIAAAAGSVTLLMGDDVRPSGGLLARHAEFHRAHPAKGDALLGRVIPAPELDDSGFISWLHECGVQFGFADLDPGRPVPPECFWTANVSTKTDLLREVGGFDEGFEGAACEDTELGLRLAQAGMRLHFDPQALAEHFHPTDLSHTLERMKTIGRAYRTLGERAPGFPMPRRPGARHRLKALALTGLYLARIRPARVQHASWRFLCDEVQREAYWAYADSGSTPKVGATLARLATSGT